MDSFLTHSIMTDPGDHADAVARLPDDVAGLLDVTRGHFVHDAGFVLYDLSASDFSEVSRETLPLHVRLNRIFACSDEALAIARPVDRRQIGTCRDYAVMLCGFLRSKEIPSRVRCGFAQYFSPNRYDDHWICEYWRADQSGWARADAQLDEVHCRHYGIAFDTADMPCGAFLTAGEVWRSCRGGNICPDRCGSGDVVGELFLWVNLVRDYFALCGRETSDWDQWREALPMHRRLDDAGRQACDMLADRIDRLELDPQQADGLAEPLPFWRG